MTSGHNEMNVKNMQDDNNKIKDNLSIEITIMLK